MNMEEREEVGEETERKGRGKLATEGNGEKRREKKKK